MKKLKANNLVRLLAFFLIAGMLICIVGFSANGWQSMTEIESNSGKADIYSGKADNDKRPTQAPDNTTPIPEINTVKYYDYLTGKEVTLAASTLKKAAILMRTDSPMYGISKGDLLIEFPTESNTSTRLLVYTDSINTLGKIGSIAPTRGYISSMIDSFGGILVASGSDDKIQTVRPDTSGRFFDLSSVSGYSYTEYTDYIYSNDDLLKAGFANNGFSTTEEPPTDLPFAISTDSDYTLLGETALSTVTLAFSGKSTTELCYQSDTKTYLFCKNGSKKSDLLYDKDVCFKNVFILFADSVTYEYESGSELVMSTNTSGKGYYLRDGVYTEINWSKDGGGAMHFTNSKGELLTVGAGNSYIGFLKSSQLSDFKIK